MTQLNTSAIPSSEILHNSEDETFTYNGSIVKIITVFNDNKGSTALIEDENGEILQVPRNSLR